MSAIGNFSNGAAASSSSSSYMSDDDDERGIKRSREHHVASGSKRRRTGAAFFSSYVAEERRNINDSGFVQSHGRTIKALDLATPIVPKEVDQYGYLDLAASEYPRIHFPEFFPIKKLPAELIQQILNDPVLSDIEQAKAREVCKLWSHVVKPENDPQVTVYGKKAWETYFGYQIEGEVPPLPDRILEEVKLLRSQLKGEQEAPRCMLALMPKGLTLNKLIELMKEPGKGDATPIRDIWSRIEEELGDKAIEETHWVLFTEGVIEGSRNMPYADQKKLVASKTDGKCSLPALIDAVACVALKHAKTGERILSDHPLTYTRCQETIYELPLIVGGFSSAGLYVYFYFSSLHDDGSYGVAACRKF